MRAFFALLCCMLMARTLAIHTPRSKCMEAVHHTLGDVNKGIMKNFCPLGVIANVTSIHYNYLMPDGQTSESLHCFGDCPYWGFTQADGFFKLKEKTDCIDKIASLMEENAYLVSQLDDLQKERLYASEDFFNQENEDLKKKVKELETSLEVFKVHMTMIRDMESLVAEWEEMKTSLEALKNHMAIIDDVVENTERMLEDLKEPAPTYDEEEDPEMHILPVGEPIVEDNSPPIIPEENDEEDPVMHILPVDIVVEEPIVVKIDEVVVPPIKEVVQEVVSNIQVLDEVSIEEVASMMSH